MTDQPPVQQPQQPGQPGQPGQQGPGNPATQPMPPAAGGPSAAPAPAPRTGLWHETMSTRGGRWAVAVAGAALVALMVLVVAVAGIVALRTHDLFSPMGHRMDGYSRGQGGQGGQGGSRQPLQPGMPGAPGMRDGGDDGGDSGLGGLGGLGGLRGGAALHGNVTATIDGSVQALAFQRGQVTAVSATSITLKSSDGFVGTYGRTAATRVTMATPVKGGQAFVLARVSDKVAVTILSSGADEGVGPDS